MNESEVSSRVASEASLSMGREGAVNAMFSAISGARANGESGRIAEFGTF